MTPKSDAIRKEYYAVERELREDQHAADQRKIAALVAALEEGHTPPTTFQNCAHPKCKLARAALALAKDDKEAYT